MFNPDPSFWAQRRVLVTGHTGFKGSWLCSWLLGLGAKITGYALEPPTTPAMFDLLSLGERMDSVIGDVRDLERLQAAVREAQPSVIFHLAAQPLVRSSYADPLGTYATNVMGTAHLLEAARSVAGLEAVVVVTSDKCYANRGDERHHTEDDPMGGHDPYSSSKGCAELVTAAYRASYYGAGACASPARIATARAGNVIGGGDWAKDRLVPDAARAVAERRPLQIRNPHAVRPWQHVLEPVCAYLVLAEKLCSRGGPAFEGAWNIGPLQRDARTVGWIVEELATLLGDRFAWKVEAGDHPHEAKFLMLDIHKSLVELGYAPRTDLATALKWTVRWYEQYLAGEDMARCTQEQIAAFSAAGT